LKSYWATTVNLRFSAKLAVTGAAPAVTAATVVAEEMAEPETGVSLVIVC
jgi:hypothetical protein